MNSIKLKIIDLWKLTCYLIECSFIDAVISNFWQKKKVTILQENVTIIYRDTENSLKKNTQYSVLQHSYSVSCMHLCYWKLVLLVFASIKYWMLLSFPGGSHTKSTRGASRKFWKRIPKRYQAPVLWERGFKIFFTNSLAKLLLDSWFTFKVVVTCMLARLFVCLARNCR